MSGTFPLLISTCLCLFLQRKGTMTTRNRVLVPFYRGPLFLLRSQGAVRYHHQLAAGSPRYGGSWWSSSLVSSQSDSCSAGPPLVHSLIHSLIYYSRCQGLGRWREQTGFLLSRNQAGKQTSEPPSAAPAAEVTQGAHYLELPLTRGVISTR